MSQMAPQEKVLLTTRVSDYLAQESFLARFYRHETVMAWRLQAILGSHRTNIICSTETEQIHLVRSYFGHIVEFNFQDNVNKKEILVVFMRVVNQ